MRILILSNLFPPSVMGGYELACFDAARALSARGHTVRVLTTSALDDATGDEGPPAVRRALEMVPVYGGAAGNGWTANEFGWASVPGMLVHARNSEILISEIECFAPDIAYVWNIVGIGGLGLMGVIQAMGIPWTWHLFDDIPRALSSPGGEAWPGLAAFASSMLRGTFISCSRALWHEVQDGGISETHPVRFVPGWISGRASSSTAMRSDAEQIRLVTTGFLGPHKGLRHMVQALGYVRTTRGARLQLDVFGPVHDPEALAIAEEIGVRDQLRLMGTRDRDSLGDIFGQYDAFLFPTWPREPFGLAPLEAGAHGCAPIITDRAGISEWLVDSVHCVKIRPNAESLAAALIGAFDARIDLRAIGGRARRMIIQDFSEDRWITVIEDILMEAAAGQRAVGGTGRIDVGRRAEALVRVALNHQYAHARRRFARVTDQEKHE